MAHAIDLSGQDILTYLKTHEHKDLLRFITCGSVDDGKSTLIGRLLYESKLVYEDQLAAARRRTRRRSARRAKSSISRCWSTAWPPSANRASPSTWPTASSPPRSASSSSPTRPATSSTRATWSPAPPRPTWPIILIDARKGVLTQTRRHSYIVSLLGIRHVVLAVNKMDVVDYSQATFDAIVADYRDFAQQIGLDERSPAFRCPR